MGGRGEETGKGKSDKIIQPSVTNWKNRQPDLKAPDYLFRGNRNPTYGADVDALTSPALAVGESIRLTSFHPQLCQELPLPHQVFPRSAFGVVFCFLNLFL